MLFLGADVRANVEGRSVFWKKIIPSQSWVSLPEQYNVSVTETMKIGKRCFAIPKTPELNYIPTT